MSQNLIKVGFLVSYDYEYMKTALPLVYNYADTITLAIDKNRETWSGERFEIDPSFFDWVKEIDRDNKIQIYEDSFHVEGLSTIECDTRERNMLSQFMEEGGWHIQIDSDEYFLDFEGFISYLRTLDISKPTEIHAELITLYQKDDSGYFYTDSNETFPLATNVVNDYRLVRKTVHGTPLYTKFKLLHQSWARSEEEIIFKLKSWGHKNDFDVDAYFQFWKAVNRHTYKYVRSFHPLDGWIWQTLEYIPSLNMNEVISIVRQKMLDKEKQRHIDEKIKLKDWVPLALYKLKAKINK